MRITSVESTDLFVGTAQRPLQLVRVGLASDEPAADVRVRVEGPGVTTPFPAVLTSLEPGDSQAVEIGVEVAAPRQPGSPRAVTVIAEAAAGRAEQQAEITVADTGWTMWMVSHFHYDPVWWDTQGEFTQSRLLLPDEHGNLPEARTAFELVALHLDAARRDPDYKFVLAELDYLKPHFDACPEDRADLRAFIADGRIEIVGGNYNEPNTNLTNAESTIRNAAYGIGYQRDVLGGDPRSAWMLDVFGHDPGYPGLMAAAGLTSSSWARGPFHQWGPHGTVGSNERMQFASEFEWISPDGTGLLTSYMANHYGAGWAATHRAPDLETAMRQAHEQFQQLAPVAATPNVLLPVGADHVIPARWATGIHRAWNERYVWPRFVTAVPREFFAAVRGHASSAGTWITPQTRDMNPVYPGKDVSYIDTKQAQRAGEVAVGGAERLATLAWLVSQNALALEGTRPGAPDRAPYRYPAESLDKAWRQLVFGAHHDAITGTESDQVYLDLLGGWREAWQRGHDALTEAAGYLASQADTRFPRGSASGAVVVFNTLSRPRSSMVSVTVDAAEPPALLDDNGRPQPCLVQPGGEGQLTLTFRAQDVPALGYRTYWLIPLNPGPRVAGGWRPADGFTIANERFTVTADQQRGGALVSIVDRREGTGLLRDGAVGNELLLQEEYANHPQWNEGPWLLSPKGPGRGSASRPARVRAERCPAGARLVAEFTDGDLRITQETLLWEGGDRVEFVTHVDGSIGQDHLLRVRFGADVPGGLPVYQTATAAIGRPPGATGTDVAEHWFTLDNPAHEWVGVGATARVALTSADGGEPVMQAIGVAEVVTPDIPYGEGRDAVRELMAALAGQGVTGTCSAADGPRYGAMDLDSNVPDFRIALGGGEQNPFTAQVLAAAGPAYEKELAGRLRQGASGRLWVPAARPRAEVMVPGADVRGVRDLPVLIVAARDAGGLAEAIRQVAADLADSVIDAGPAVGDDAGELPYGASLAGETPYGGRSVAVLNRGTPGSLVTPDGTVNVSLMRACSAWPCGVWIDGERRTAPDGSSFAWQHWTHSYEYALAAGPGDWRAAGFTAASEDFNTDLLACVADVHEGPLPARASLCSVEPAQVTLTALKPRGNPLAVGRPHEPAVTDGLSVRLRETAGRPAQARVVLPGWRARHTDLLEEADGGWLPGDGDAAGVHLTPGGLACLAFSPVDTQEPRPAAPLAARPEPAQPVYTRYWMHGKGPAPAGNLPVAVHISPDRVTLGGADGAAEAVLRVSVACGLEPAAGEVVVELPGGLELTHGGQAAPYRYQLESGEHATWDVTVRPAPGATSGRYFVAAAIGDGLGQRLEDAALVTVGTPGRPDLSLPLEQVLPLIEADQQALAGEIGLAVPGGLELAPGQRGELAAVITNRVASAVRGEAQLVSPVGSWPLLTPWTQGFAAGPGESVTLRYPVAVPASARAGAHWWAVVKVMYFGRVRYSQAVEVRVTR